MSTLFRHPPLTLRIFQGNPSPSPDDVVGAVSCIIWSLTLVPLLKYCWIVLRAGDDQGEGTHRPDLCLTIGGTFVLYMLLSRYLKLDRHAPGYSSRQPDSLLLTATETVDSTTDLSGRAVKGSYIRESKFLRLSLLLWTLFGASCVIADGLLTPAVSVISAVAGINVILVVTDFRYCGSCT